MASVRSNTAAAARSLLLAFACGLSSLQLCACSEACKTNHFGECAVVCDIMASCSNNGRCKEDGTCACQLGWGGDTCSCAAGSPSDRPSGNVDRCSPSVTFTAVLEIRAEDFAADSVQESYRSGVAAAVDVDVADVFIISTQAFAGVRRQVDQYTQVETGVSVGPSSEERILKALTVDNLNAALGASGVVYAISDKLTSAGTAAAASSPGSTSPVPTASPGPSSSTPAIIGGIIGGVLLLAVAAGGCVWVRRHNRRVREHNQGAPGPVVTGGVSGRDARADAAIPVADAPLPGSLRVDSPRPYEEASPPLNPKPETPMPQP